MIQYTTGYYQDLSIDELYNTPIEDVLKSFMQQSPSSESLLVGKYWDDCCTKGLLSHSMSVYDYINHCHMRVLHALDNCPEYSPAQRREAVAAYVAFMYYVSRISRNSFKPFA